MNSTRTHLRDELDQLIADYNAGTKDVGEFFQELFAVMKKLENEDRRTESERLIAEELASASQSLWGGCIWESGRCGVHACDRGVLRGRKEQIPG